MTRVLLLAAVLIPAVFGLEVVFPEVTASNLNGEAVTFPHGLKGERNLILMGFEREHQGAIDTWLRVLPGIASGNAGFAYYEVPVIARLNPMIRWWIDGGMRRGIPDKDQRGRTVTFYIDKAGFRKALGIAGEEQIQMLLIDRAGKVLWRAEGSHTAELETGLIRALENLAKHI